MAATESRVAASRCAATLENPFDEQRGFIPAVLDGGAIKSAIVPGVVEALVWSVAHGLKEAVTKTWPIW
jgi:hypothetical protein